MPPYIDETQSRGSLTLISTRYSSVCPNMACQRLNSTHCSPVEARYFSRTAMLEPLNSGGAARAIKGVSWRTRLRKGIWLGRGLTALVSSLLLSIEERARSLS